MRTHFECDGVGPSKMKSWCQPGGDTPEFGGAVMVHVAPEHEKAGNIVLAPMAFPWVLEVATNKRELGHGSSLAGAESTNQQ